MADTDGGTAVLDAPATDVAATATESSTPAVAAAPSPAEASEAVEETPEQKDERERDEAGRFKAKETDYSTVILPKDATIDAAVLEKTVAIARAQGFSAEQTQATVDLINEQVGASRADVLASHQPGGAEWTKQVDGWRAETLADPSLGKTPEERKAAIALGGQVIKQFKAANPEMGAAIETFLDTSGIGDRREMAHLMAFLGKSAGERPLSTANDPGNAPTNLVNVFYPRGPNRTAAEVASDGP